MEAFTLEACKEECKKYDKIILQLIAQKRNMKKANSELRNAASSLQTTIKTREEQLEKLIAEYASVLDELEAVEAHIDANINTLKTLGYS